jgi:hypothetical protein
MKPYQFLAIVLACLTSLNAVAQTTETGQKVQMQYIATFEAGQPGAGIYKLYDASDDIICYVLMPDTAARKQVEGKWVYDSNTLGSLSCLKANTSVKSPVKK